MSFSFNDIARIKYNAVKMLQYRGYKVSLPEEPENIEEFPELEIDMINEFIEYQNVDIEHFDIDNVRVVVKDGKASLLKPGQNTRSEAMSFLSYVKRTEYKNADKLPDLVSLSEVFYSPESNSFIMLFFAEKESLVKEEWTKINSIACSLKIPRVIVISEKLSQSNIARIMENNGPCNYNTSIRIPDQIIWEYFSYGELVICIVEHSLAPKFEGILSAEERKHLDSLGFGPANSTYRERDDPFVKFYGIGVREMVKFKTFNPIPGTLIDSQIDYHTIIPPKAKK